ncbi:MAG TPA: Clp protease N-terminal domain-containing protein [Ktedonobacteraceae bacterium]|nr:Clp protease N-terminal domain-containing protein [Ktedonobacteraceae bacterium]
MERLLTTEEVADLLRIEPVTVRRLVTRGELIGYRIAGEYRFAPEDVEKFVQGQRVTVNIRPGPDHPFAKFTERARKVLTLANEEAHRYNHDGIGTEHVLLALMEEGEGVAARALNLLKLRQDEVRDQIEMLHPAGEHAIEDAQIGMTQHGKASIELAVQEALLLKHHYIGTEHLLLGLIREQEDITDQIFRRSGVTLEKTRTLIKQILAGETATVSEPKRQAES